MTSRYVITLTDQAAAEMERWLGSAVFLIPSPWGDEKAARVAALDAITDEEFAPIATRLASGPPLYHHGGPGGAS